MNQRIIITGGTGFIGKTLCLRLIQTGYDIVILTRNVITAQMTFNQNNHVVIIEWNGRTNQGGPSYADGAYAIINLAGENIAASRWTNQKKQMILNSRLQAGQAVVEAIRQAKQKPAVLIQASAIGYYGDRGDETLDESSAMGDGFLADVVQQWEASTHSVESLGVRRAVVRLGVVLGKEGGMLKSMLPAFRAFAGGYPGNGKQRLSWTHIADAVEAIRFLLEENTATGVYNLTSPQPVTMKMFCKTLGKVLHRPCVLPIPKVTLRLMMGEMADELLLTSQHVLPKRLEEAGFKFEYPDISEALTDILRNESC